ncbi:MAG: hypothetical protein E7331_10760 [Clostridiales bacterium]|nr:hypothetical protein [Clostridiales bacterium]
MKKILALVLCLMLCITASMALASENKVALEVITMDDGFTFAVPSNWEYMELDEEMIEEGVILIACDVENDLMMTAFLEPLDMEVTAQEFADQMVQDEEFGFAQVYTNAHGQELILYEYTDHTVVGFFVLQDDGFLAAFNYSRITDDISVADNTLLQQMLMETIENVYYVK